MMTVKHITLSGEEYIYPTTHVNFVPDAALNQVVNQVGGKDTVWLYPPDHPAQPLNGGTVFVMNEHGKTVSRYDLGALAEELTVQNTGLGTHAPLG